MNSVTYRENLFVMKLLTTDQSFLGDVIKMRKRFGIPVAGFREPEAHRIWKLGQLKRAPKKYTTLYYEGSYDKSCRDLTIGYGMKIHFLPHIKNFVLSGTVEAPKKNYQVSPDRSLFAPLSIHAINIRAYSPLTKDEIRGALKEQNEQLKRHLPRLALLDWRPRIDVDTLFRIESEMDKRTRRILEDRPSFYLQQIRKSYGEAEYQKLKRTNQWHVDKVMVGYTSREVAKKVLGDARKAAIVRKVYSRLKAKRRQINALKPSQ